MLILPIKMFHGDRSGLKAGHFASDGASTKSPICDVNAWLKEWFTQ